jgi:hypothetical protein
MDAPVVEEEMRRALIGVAAALLFAATIRCAHAADDRVSITTTESLVSGCRSLGPIRVPAAHKAVDRNQSLAVAARAAGANTVLLDGQDATTGVAYRCTWASGAAR